MKIKMLLCLAGSIVLAGCTQAEYMKDPKTGVIATCGDHPAVFPIYAMVAMGGDQACVKNYQDEGYVRVPSN